MQLHDLDARACADGCSTKTTSKCPPPPCVYNLGDELKSICDEDPDMAVQVMDHLLNGFLDIVDGCVREICCPCGPFCR